jgi:hypothetical protein
MDYLRIYNELIEHRKMMPKLDGVYYERHHIVPVCMGGGDEDENLVYLTAEDHFMAHLLLARTYRTKELWFAVTAMELSIRGVREIKNRRAFAIARQEAALLSVKNNEKRKWIRIADGEIFELTRTELFEKFGVPLDRTRYVVCENYGNKIANGFALYGVDTTSGCVDRQIYNIVRVSDDTEMYVTRKQMFDELGLTRGHVNGLVYGNTKISGGYYRKDLWGDDIKGAKNYEWKNVVRKFTNVAGDEFHASAKEIQERFNLTRKQMVRLKQGRAVTPDKIRLVEVTA